MLVLVLGSVVNLRMLNCERKYYYCLFLKQRQFHTQKVASFTHTNEKNILIKVDNLIQHSLTFQIYSAEQKL